MWRLLRLGLLRRAPGAGYAGDPLWENKPGLAMSLTSVKEKEESGEGD